MAKSWSNAWKSSTDASKQRKFAKNSPMHIKRRLLSAHLSDELRAQYGTRSFPVRKGDVVSIVAGQFAGKSGKVTMVSVSRGFVHVEGATIKRADASESFYPMKACKLVLTKLDLSDKARVAKLESFKKGVAK